MFGREESESRPLEIFFRNLKGEPSALKSLRCICGHVTSSKGIEDNIFGAVRQKPDEELRKLLWESCRVDLDIILLAVRKISSVGTSIGKREEIRRDGSVVVGKKTGRGDVIS